ncbi:hypothetical protein [Sorangium sp. So ce854]|uniref:hypothetical protein n=1 Tax=Sorangium sp. So ce854 TaxID=3133322 RepID=UPI003F6457E0
MHPAEMLPEIPFRLLNPLYQAWRNGIDRLGLIDADTEAVGSSGVLTADAALARLSDAGLACRRAAGGRLHIQGGTRDFDVRGVRGYECPFAIVEVPAGGFAAAVAGIRPFHDEEVPVATLAKAVETVIRIYHSRGLLSAEDRR